MLFASLAISLTLAVARAQTDWGTIEPRDWSITYSSQYASTSAFCSAWRLACIDYVGARGYHHSVECQLNQPGPTVKTICAAIQKEANGDYGHGPPFDFTTEIVNQSPGQWSIAGNPQSPIQAYQGDSAPPPSDPSSTSSSSTSDQAPSSTSQADTQAAASSTSTESAAIVTSSSDLNALSVSVSTSTSSPVVIVTVTSSSPAMDSVDSVVTSSSSMSLTRLTYMGSASATPTINAAVTSGANKKTKSVLGACALMVISGSLLLLA